MSKNHDDFLDFKNKYIKYKKKYMFEKQKGGMFWRTKKTIPDEIIPFIKKWVSIENIICRKGDFDLQDKLGTGTYINNKNFKGIDTCESITDMDVCSKTTNCKKYVSASNQSTRCVNQYRIGKIEGNEKANVINGTFGDEFKIYYTLLYDMNVYCHILVNEDNNIFILFNCGSVFDSNKLYADLFVKYLRSIYEYIYETFISNESAEKKIILCGHSMGCVFASRFGQWLSETNPDFFKTKCMVIGSGPFKWLKKTDAKKFNNLDNVFIFLQSIYCDTNKEYKNDLILSDNYTKEFNLSEFTVHLPMYNLKAQYIFENDEYDNVKINVKLKKQKEIPSNFCNNFETCHAWEVYKESFMSLFEEQNW